MSPKVQRHKCSISSCQTYVGPLYRYPKPRSSSDISRCLEWIRASGNKSLLALSKEIIVNKRICGRHFPIQVKMASKLTKWAVPTVDLPDLLSE